MVEGHLFLEQNEWKGKRGCVVDRSMTHLFTTRQLGVYQLINTYNGD